MSQGFYNWTTATELGTGIVLVVGAVATCIGIIFKGSANSRCSQINICWGLLSCERKVKSKVEIDLEQQQQQEEQEQEENNNIPNRQRP